MTQRTNTANILRVYFEQKGHILTPAEYKAAKDAPVRFAVVKKVFGSWNRMENIVREFNIRNKQRSEQEPTSDIEEVLLRQVQAAAEYEAKMRAASEDVDAKTAREEAARQHLERDKLNAATAEGAFENKMRKGGVTSQDAKARKEAIEHAIAEEHALLTQTAAGATLGKHLLGGVEDNDEKTRVIEEQNAFREKTKLKAATPLGAAEAKLMEDDTDGQLSREAQARIRAELRTYVPPVADGNVEQAQSEATRKMRQEAQEVVTSGIVDENIRTGSAAQASTVREALRVRNAVGIDELPKEIVATMPPADQPVAEEDQDVLFPDEDGNPREDIKVETKEEAKQGQKEMTSEAAENEKNPEATPADRNPDPKLGAAGSGDDKQGNDTPKPTPSEPTEVKPEAVKGGTDPKKPAASANEAKAKPAPAAKK